MTADLGRLKTLFFLKVFKTHLFMDPRPQLNKYLIKVFTTYHNGSFPEKVCGYFRAPNFHLEQGTKYRHGFTSY